MNAMDTITAEIEALVDLYRLQYLAMVGQEVQERGETDDPPPDLYALERFADEKGEGLAAQVLWCSPEWVKKMVSKGGDTGHREMSWLISIREELEDWEADFRERELDRHDGDPRRIQPPKERVAVAVKQLGKFRDGIGGVGTREMKCGLNKLAENDSVAKALRLALEVEDRNLQMKADYGVFRQKKHRQKIRKAWELIDVMEAMGWSVGVDPSERPYTFQMAYFEIPGVEQLSWKIITLEEMPSYGEGWDGRDLSNLPKIETAVQELYPGILG